MPWIDLLTMTNIVITLLVTVITGFAGFIVWFYRRVRKIAKEANPVDLATATKVQNIEAQLGQVSKSVGHIDSRVTTMERKMESVATQKDITELSKESSGMAASIRMMEGMLDTIYKAALSGASSGSDK